MRRLATEIGRAGSAAVQEFSRLLDDSRNGVQGWAAFHILELMDAPSDVVDRAFEVLERLAKGTGMHALGTRTRSTRTDNRRDWRSQKKTTGMALQNLHPRF
jgi:hypothetical protein